MTVGFFCKCLGKKPASKRKTSRSVAVSSNKNATQAERRRIVKQAAASNNISGNEDRVTEPERPDQMVEETGEASAEVHQNHPSSCEAGKSAVEIEPDDNNQGNAEVRTTGTETAPEMEQNPVNGGLTVEVNNEENSGIAETGRGYTGIGFGSERGGSVASEHQLQTPRSCIYDHKGKKVVQEEKHNFIRQNRTRNRLKGIRIEDNGIQVDFLVVKD